MSRSILISVLLAALQKQAKVNVAETRKLENGTEVKILVGTLPVLPTKSARHGIPS